MKFSMACLLSVFPPSMDMIGPLVRFPETYHYGRLPSIPLPVFSCPIAALVPEDYIGAQSLYTRDSEGDILPWNKSEKIRCAGIDWKTSRSEKKSLIVAGNKTQFRRIKKSFIQKWLIRENQLKSVLRPSVGCLPPTPPQRRLFCFFFLYFFIRKLPLNGKTDEDHQIMKSITKVQCSENRELLWTHKIAIYTSNAAILSAHSTFVASEERRRNQTLRINCTWSGGKRFRGKSEKGAKSRWLQPGTGPV